MKFVVRRLSFDFEIRIEDWELRSNIVLADLYSKCAVRNTKPFFTLDVGHWTLDDPSTRDPELPLFHFQHWENGIPGIEVQKLFVFLEGISVGEKGRKGTAVKVGKFG